MRISAVIGANYGDEGKGQTVHSLSDRTTLVVRYNGGAQAGHTVEAGGKRHVFRHFGSGFFKGAPTYLSKYFVVNPMLFRPEFEELRKLGASEGRDPVVFVDPDAQVTTPFDIMLNQAVEKKRGINRHGSCGVGFNETIKRGEHRKDFKFTFKDIGMAHSQMLLDRICEEYVPERAKDLGLEITDLPYYSKSGTIIKSFTADCVEIANRIEPVAGLWDAIYRVGSESVVFEGAQGLRLDEFAAGFPHVTHSRTGLNNVIELLDGAGLNDDPLHVFYVTRPYITRHGAGPLPHEVATQAGLDCFRIVDHTNIPNDYQGSLRFAWHDPEAMVEIIQADYDHGVTVSRVLGGDYPIFPEIATTCMGQLKCAGMQWIENGALRAGSGDEWEEKVTAAVRSLYAGPATAGPELRTQT